MNMQNKALKTDQQFFLVTDKNFISPCIITIL